MPGARPHPQPCVQVKKARKQVTTGTPRSSGIPCTTVVRLIARSSRGAGLDSPRRLPITGKLDSSVGESGPHAFAVRVGAARLAAPKRPSHPKPNVRGDRASAPLLGSGRGIMALNRISVKAKYFLAGVVDKRIWGREVICPSGKINRATTFHSHLRDRIYSRAARSNSDLQCSQAHAVGAPSAL
jgi:hypothetical protein